MISQVSTADSRPIIHLTTVECDVLWEVALGAEDKHPRSAAMLVAELERAVLCDRALPHRPNDNSTSICRRGTVSAGPASFPNDAASRAGDVNFAPVGAGLIGMSAGHSIPWPDREGHVRFLRIDSVTPPDRA